LNIPILPFSISVYKVYAALMFLCEDFI
jgi:hypothetical protein